MDASLIIMSVIGVLVGSALVISSIENHKRHVVYEAWSYLKDLIDVMDTIGLNKDYLDRYALPDLMSKIKVVRTLIQRSNERMNDFIELNKHVKFISASDAQKLKHSYELNIDNIQMSLNAVQRSIETYGVSSAHVYELIKRRDRMMVITGDGLRFVQHKLKIILDEIDKT